MDLILWRHAEAVEREGLPDLERMLTSKGERQAQRMADWLNHRIAHSTRVLASPALRCQQTAKALGRKFRTIDTIAPEASPEALLAAARWPEASEPVLVIGHQPTLGQVAALLICGQAQPWAVRKGAVWWLRSRDREGSAQVVLHAVMGPDGL
jgi:phosphohistidine phosphatase